MPDNDHDPTGLDLARGIADATAGAPARRRKPPAVPAARWEPAHRDRDDPAPLADAVGRFTKDEGWERHLGVHQVMARWSSIVGADVAAHAQPEAFSDGVVRVRTSSTAWATQLRMMAPTIVAKMNAELGDGTVTRVHVVGPQAPSWKHGIRSVRDGRGPRDTYG